MQVMYQRCAGIDVHLRFLVVCLYISQVLKFYGPASEILCHCFCDSIWRIPANRFSTGTY